mgnify:FL=1
MKKNLLLFFIFLSFISFQNLSYAEEVHGIAMHGKPKYESNFTNLDYVNPNAPKGGVVKFG